MADNQVIDNPTNGNFTAVADEITSPYTGGLGKAQAVKLLSGTVDSNAVIPGDAANGLDVDVTRVPADPYGANADAAVVTDAAGSLSGKMRGLVKWAFERMPASLGQKAMAASFPVVVASDQSAVPVSGTITANAGSGTFTVDSELTTADLDTGVGVDTRAVVGLALAASGGALLVGSANPVPVSDNAGSLTVDNAGTFAVQDSEKVADNAAFTDGTTKVQPAGYVFDEVAGTALTENDAAAARIDSKRAQVLVLEDATTRGQRAAVTAANAVKVDGSAVTQPVSGTVTSNVGTGTRPVAGDVAHDGVDSGNPVKVGAKAIAHGANPTAVAAADRTDLFANRHGVQFTIGGHPNAKSATYITTAAGTDDNVMAAIAGGTKYAVTRITITLDESTTVGVGVRLGFGATTVPALGASQADAVDDILVYHPGLVPGGGITIGDGSGVLGVGGDGAELRITNEVPTSGTLAVTVTYFTIES